MNQSGLFLRHRQTLLLLHSHAFTSDFLSSASSSPVTPPPFTTFHSPTSLCLRLPVFISPSSRPFNVKDIKELSWNDKCFIRPRFQSFIFLKGKYKGGSKGKVVSSVEFISVTSHPLIPPPPLVSPSLSLPLPYVVVWETSSDQLASSKSCNLQWKLKESPMMDKTLCLSFDSYSRSSTRQHLFLSGGRASLKSQ